MSQQNKPNDDRSSSRLSRRPEKDYAERLKKEGIELGELIGSGSFGKVVLCRVFKDAAARDSLSHYEGERFACKTIDKSIVSSSFLKKFLPRELKILRNVNHSNIVKLHKILSIYDRIYIITEHLNGSNILRYLRVSVFPRLEAILTPENQTHIRFNEHDSQKIFRQVADAVEYLHKNRIVHRDLKCENIIIEPSSLHAKLIDFGFARYTYDSIEDGDTQSETFCGSAAYAAPEILQGKRYTMRPYDMWSLGIVLFVMLTGSLPFGEKSNRRIMERQRRGIKNVQKMNEGIIAINSALKHLLCGLLEVDPEVRLTIEQVQAHRWLSRM